MTCLNRDEDLLDELEDSLDDLEDNLADAGEGTGAWNPHGYMPGWWIPCATFMADGFNPTLLTLPMASTDVIRFSSMYVGSTITIDKITFECNRGCSGTLSVAFYIEAGGLPYKPQHTRGPLAFTNPTIPEDPSIQWGMVELDLDPVIELDEAVYWVASKWTGDGQTPMKSSDHHNFLIGNPFAPWLSKSSALWIPQWTAPGFPDPCEQNLAAVSQTSIGGHAPFDMLQGTPNTHSLAVRIQPEPEE